MPSNLVRGDLAAFNIFDVTQSLMMGRKTAEVTIQNEARIGYIYFQDGQIVAALDDALATGERAAMNLFSWREGTFAIDMGKEPTATNIEMPTDHLLLEVARNMDEVRRDHGLGEEEAPGDPNDEVAANVQERIEDRLRNELNSAFHQVATAAEPARARYTQNAFDACLRELIDLSGTVLFLRPGTQPRIKTSQGFETMRGEVIDGDEVDSFLNGLLSDRETVELRERKEVTTFFHSDTAGSFRLHVINERGKHLMAFTPVSRQAPELHTTLETPANAAKVHSVTEGMILVAGPMGSGKADTVAAIIRDQIDRRGAFAYQFARSSHHVFSSDNGFCVQREMPPPGLGFAESLRTALEQSPDVLALVGAHDIDAFALALSASTDGRVVIFTVESQSPSHTLSLMSRLARTPDGDALLDALAERLQLIVDLMPRQRGAQRSVTSLALDDETRNMLRQGDMEGLRRARISAGS